MKDINYINYRADSGICGDCMSELTNVGLIINELLTTPPGTIATVLQIILGIILGYLATKAIKYILALLAIMFISSLLLSWSIESLSQETLSKIGATLAAVKDLVIALTIILIGPLAFGFFIGVLIAIFLK